MKNRKGQQQVNKDQKAIYFTSMLSIIKGAMTMLKQILNKVENNGTYCNKYMILTISKVSILQNEGKETNSHP